MPSPHFEPGQSPEEQIERKVHSILTELDELCVMAMNVETAALLELLNQKSRLINVLVHRAVLIPECLAAHRTPKFRLVCNG